MKDTQISAQISESTRVLLENYTRQTGVKKGHLVEQALLHHLQALDDIPAEYIIHPRITVSLKIGEQLLRQGDEKKVSPALRELMQNGN